jgi:hypothetical protein
MSSGMVVAVVLSSIAVALCGVIISDKVGGVSSEFCSVIMLPFDSSLIVVEVKVSTTIVTLGVSDGNIAVDSLKFRVRSPKGFAARDLFAFLNWL